MKERPILFSAPMVRAILAGTKTQTRRLMKSQPPEESMSDVRPLEIGLYNPTVVVRGVEEPGPEFFGACTYDGDWCLACPYGQPVDRLWVREAWAAPHNCDHLKPSEIDRDWRIHYAATEDRGGLLWRPSIHMPRWASRIMLELTDVRVERLQDISEADAIAEGVHADPGCRQDDDAAGFHRIGAVRGDSFPIARYADLWENINGFSSWDANPFVWVVEFKVIK